ncbi:MAG: hypothetical protein AAFQ45_08435 [Pseudomonadota bacterium]
MPYFYDTSDEVWPDDGSEPPPPKPSAFMYLEPRDFGVDREPVPINYPGLKANAASDKPGFKERVMRTFGIVPDPPTSGAPAAYEREMADLIRRLRGIGIERLYVRYDGGNDEGFGWVAHGERTSGEHVSVDAMVQDLGRDGSGAPDGTAKSLQDDLRHGLGSDLAARMFGGGFGTGEYLMFGALYADLHRLTLVEDRNAEPVVENIDIGSD